MKQISMDSLAIILLCSDLGLTNSTELQSKPFTVVQWHKFSEKILNSSLKRPEALLSLDEDQILRSLHLSEEEAKRISKLLSRKGNIAIEIERLASKGINIVTRADEAYPQRLKKILRKKSPPLIYYSGDIKLVNQEAIAIVGSRNIGSSEEEFTRSVAKRAVEKGFNVISGGARGVDSIAETTSLLSGGRSISIVSDSLSKRIITKETRNAILNGKLLVMSFVHPDSNFKGYNAMDRNKYVYVLSQCAVVVSSANGTGGTWAGAVENIKNNWVPVLVRSDNEAPDGNRELIKMGGRSFTEKELVESGFDIISDCDYSEKVMESESTIYKITEKETAKKMSKSKQMTFTL